MKKLSVFVPLLAVMLGACAQVDADEVGLVLDRKEATKCVGTGWHSTIGIGKEVATVKTGAERSDMTAALDEGDNSKDESIATPSSDGSMINWDITVNYRVNNDCEKIKGLWTNRFRDEAAIRDRLVRPAVRSGLREIVAKYDTLTAITTGRGKIQGELTVLLNEKLEKAPSNGAVSIDSVELRGTKVDAATQTRLNAATEARAAANKAEIDRKTKEIEADTKYKLAVKQFELEQGQARAAANIAKTQAESAAVVAEINAKTEAAKKVAAAEAQAKANKLISDSLTQDLKELEIAKAQAEALSKAGTVIVGGGSGAGSQVILDARP